MTNRLMRALIALGASGFVVGVISSPQFRDEGFYPFGAWTGNISEIAFIVCIGTFGWAHGWCMGNREGEEIQAAADDQADDDQARIDRLAELLGTARADVQDAVALGHEASYREGLEYLTSVLDFGSLSDRQYHRAAAGLPFDATYDEVLAETTADEPKG